MTYRPENYKIGYSCYLEGDKETRDWFHKQWAVHPERVDEEKTTNYEFHYGGVAAYRDVHGKEPALSASLASNEKYVRENLLK